MRLDVLHHADNLQIGAAVQRALQCADCAAVGGICVRVRGGEHAAGKGRVIAAAVLRVQHQAQIQHQRFFFCINPVAAQQGENLLRDGKTGLLRMQIHGLAVEKAAFHLIGLDRNVAHARDDLQRFSDFRFKREILRIFVIGIKRKHAAGKLVHDIGGGRFEHHILKKTLRKIVKM